MEGRFVVVLKCEDRSVIGSGTNIEPKKPRPAPPNKNFETTFSL